MENDNSKPQNYTYLIIFTLILTISSFFVGIGVGGSQKDHLEEIIVLENQETEKPEKVDFSPFWKAWKALEENHIKDFEVNTEEKVWEAIKGLTRAYKDPNTIFMPPVESKQFETEISGKFEGVGMEIGIREDVLTVISPLKGTPAEKAGILSGDRILRIDDESTARMDINEAVSKIRGQKNTNVVLNIYREDEDEPFDVSITRGIIDIPTIETEMRDDGIFVIKLFNFAGQSISKFETAMEQFHRSGSDKLILDLRNNPGGFLQASVEVSSYFLPQGEIILRENFTTDKSSNLYRSKGYTGSNKKIDMVVLINGGSASASEIVAGALGDHGVATTVGSQTFGKGTVQEVIRITSDTSMKITIAEWLTPDGHSFEGVGIKPDVEVERTREDVENEKDPQFDKATEILLK